MTHDAARRQLAYSADADDAFMFHALRAGAHRHARACEFQHRRGDTAELNALAAAGGADVVAISLGAYPAVADRYLLLPHGASVGRGYGPVVVARQADLGRWPSCWPPHRHPGPQHHRLPGAAPDAARPEAGGGAHRPLLAGVRRRWTPGEVDAALLIHEGRLLYEERGYQRVVELGEWWLAETGCRCRWGST